MGMRKGLIPCVDCGKLVQFNYLVGCDLCDVCYNTRQFLRSLAPAHFPENYKMIDNQNTDELRMPCFNENSTCDKCGYDDIGSHFRATGERGDYPEFDRHDFDVIDRACRRCHFKWRERALDEDGV